MDELDGAFSSMSLNTKSESQTQSYLAKARRYIKTLTSQFLIADWESSLTESDDDDCSGEPLNEFEQSNEHLLLLFRGDCPIFTGPQRTLRAPPTHPLEFTRVCDEQTFVQFDEITGFVNQQRLESVCIDLPTWPFIDDTSVKNHMDFRGRDETSFTKYISFCGSKEKSRRELQWRQNPRNGRGNIRVYRVDASDMSYKEISVRGKGSLLCLHKRMKGTVYDERSETTSQRIIDVVFLNAKHVIDTFEIQADIKEIAYQACQDEWLAVQRVPIEMIQS